MRDDPSLVVSAALAGLLAWAALSDLRARRIPNAVPALLVGLWLGASLFRLAPPPLASGLAAGLLALAGSFALWRAGLIGGGDAKLLAALACWAGLDRLPALLLAVAAAGGCLAGLIVLLDRSPLGGRLVRACPASGSSPSGRLSPRTLPYGIAIAAGGLWLLARVPA